MNLTIRPGTAADCGAVYGLICEMEETALDRAAFDDCFAAQRQSKRWLLLAAEADGEVVGLLNLRLEPQLHHAAAVAEILELAVKDGWRSRGVGAALYGAARAAAAERGCVRLEVCCNRLRTDAHRFYERQGMHKFHFKLSESLTGCTETENQLGR